MAVDIVAYILLGLLVLAIIVAAPFLRRWTNDRAAAAGEKAGRRYTAGRLTDVLRELGTTVVVDAPEQTVRDLLTAAVAARPRDFSSRSDGGYGIRFVEDDDTVVRVVADPAGTRMQVETFREYLGFPQTAPQWTALRTLLADSAAERGIDTAEGPHLEYLRGALLDPRNARWTLDR